MSKTISFNLSTAAILQEIYAAAALRSLDNNIEIPQLLTRDHQGALRLLIKDAFAFIVMKFIAHVESCNINDESEKGVADTSDSEEMILTLDLRMCDNITGNITGAFRIMLEHVIAAYALHICYIGKDNKTSEEYQTIAQNEIESMKLLLSSTSLGLMNITPHY